MELGAFIIHSIQIRISVVWEYSTIRSLFQFVHIKAVFSPERDKSNLDDIIISVIIVLILVVRDWGAQTFVGYIWLESNWMQAFTIQFQYSGSPLSSYFWNLESCLTRSIHLQTLCRLWIAGWLTAAQCRPQTHRSLTGWYLRVIEMQQFAPDDQIF